MLDQEFISACAQSLRKLADEIETTDIITNREARLDYKNFCEFYPTTQLADLISWVEKGPVIYKFLISEGRDGASILKRFRECKENEKTNARNHKVKARAYCKANQNSSTLYVGSSLNLESRLRQHFGYSGRTTYSMQLTHWLQAGDIETLHLSVWKCNGLSPRIVQALEDHLWDRERPLLGKRGGR